MGVTPYLLSNNQPAISQIPDLNQQRTGFSAVYKDSRVIVVGGNLGRVNIELETIEVLSTLDIAAGWTTVTSTVKIPNAYSSVFSYFDSVIIAGVANLQIYNTTTDTIETSSITVSRKHSPAMYIMDDELYLVGGKHTTTSNVYT